MQGKARLTRTRQADRDRFDQMLIEDFLAPPVPADPNRRPIPIRFRDGNHTHDDFDSFTNADSDSSAEFVAWDSETAGSSASPASETGASRLDDESWLDFDSTGPQSAEHGQTQPRTTHVRTSDATAGPSRPTSQAHGQPEATAPRAIPELTPPMFSMTRTRRSEPFSMIRFFLTLGIGLLAGGILLSAFR